MPQSNSGDVDNVFTLPLGR